MILVADATPKVGVVSDGDVAKTNAPEPVSSVTAAAKFDDEGVAKNVATLAAKPDTPVDIGKPVQFVSVPEDGVPKAGVTKVGDVAKTRFPEPVSSEITLANWDDVVAAKTPKLLPVVVNVPALGKVTLVFADIVNVVAKPPIVLKIDVSASQSVAPVDAAVKNILLTLKTLKLSVEGTYLRVASEETATPEPPFVLEKRI